MKQKDIIIQAFLKVATKTSNNNDYLIEINEKKEIEWIQFYPKEQYFIG